MKHEINENCGECIYIFFVLRTPRGLEDVSRYPELFAELLRSGKWNVLDLKKVAGLNLLRVLRKVHNYVIIELEIWDDDLEQLILKIFLPHR